jgi:hypothetical protein
MQAIFLSDLAATLAFNARSYSGHRQQGWEDSTTSDTFMVPEAAVQGYWLANRTRDQRWRMGLAHAKGLENCQDLMGLRWWWRKHLPLLEEVLISEILSRAVAGLGMLVDRMAGKEDVSPVTELVLQSHLESRSRVLKLIATGTGAERDVIVRLNHLRSSVERWSDVLIGYLTSLHLPIGRLGFDKRRVLQFARDAAEDRGMATQRTSCALLAASMRCCLQVHSGTISFSPKENQKIADAIFASLPPSAFDSLGLLKGKLQQQLERSCLQTDDRWTQSLTDLEVELALLSELESVWR